MAKYFQNPNPHSKTISFRYLRYLIFLLVFILGAALVYSSLKTNSMVFALLGFILVAVFIPFAEYIFGGDSRNDQGAVGEWEVKELLLSLPDTFSIFQNVPVRKNLDIDFIVLGPTGLFAIEVKSHRRLNAWQWSKFVNQTISETISLKKLLKKSNFTLYIHPILVFTRVPLKHPYTSKSVQVINKSSLVDTILSTQGSGVNYNNLLEVIQNLYYKGNPNI